MSSEQYSTNHRRGVTGVFGDLHRGLAQGQVWRHFAWDEIQNRYRRSALGIAWIGLSHVFFVVVIVIFFRGLSQADPVSFTRHVAIGFATFTFLVANISDGCDVFRNATTWIKSTPLPYSVYIYKSICRSIFTFAIHIALSFIIILLMGWRPAPGALWAIPALVVFLINAVSFQLLFGLFATRYRDISHLVSTITRLLFFATPILWTFDQRSGLIKTVAKFNPMTHFIEIFRAPLMGTPMIEESWMIVIGVTIFGWIAAVTAGAFMLRRLPYWL